MKYLTLTLRQPRETRHPMQNFIADSEAIEREELLAWNLLHGEDVEYELFYVEGDLGPYRDAISDVESVESFTLTPVDDESFYAYVRQVTRESDRQFRAAFADRHLLVIPPFEYTGDGHMRFTVVGESTDLQALLDDFPEELDATVEEIGEYDRRHGTVAGSLTDRQFEAASVAAELGYYEVPKSANLSTVADRLDCAESTASNLLRSAEAGVMRRVVGE